MSGFEVAGVVLGSIPLIISALEHYADGVRDAENLDIGQCTVDTAEIATMKNMRNYERVFADLNSSFAASVAIYMGSCWKLIAPLHLPDTQQKELLEDRKKEAWEDPELGKRLKARLSVDYVPYKSLVKQLNKRLIKFGEKLKLGKDLKPVWIAEDGTVDVKAQKKFFKNVWTRVKGGFDSDKYSALLAEIDRDIDKISQLTSNAIELEPIRIEQKNRLNSHYWRTIRDQAQRLFESLNSRFCPCSCQHHHKANMRLDVRKGLDAAEENSVRFAFIFTFEKDPCMPATLPWDWRDIEIETLQIPNSTATLRTAPQPSPNSKTAHFAPTITVSGTSSPFPSPSSLASKIDDLCKVLLKGPQLACCLGFIEDQPWQHQIYSVPGLGASNQISDASSLQDLLCGTDTSSLGPRAKCTLALTLATAVLQLHDTPWLSKDWDANDIFFPKSLSGTTLLDHPYVSRTFTPLTTNNPKKRQRCVKNEIVFALGVALLEISWGQPLTDLTTSDDLNDDGKADSMTNFLVATRLADAIHMRELPNYAKAVARCVRCSFDTFTYDFGDGEFREKFYEGVVVPLREDYEYATK